MDTTYTLTKQTVQNAERYLADERKRDRDIDGKFEFINNKLYEMAGASLKHNRICSNLLVMIANLTEDTGFMVSQSDLRVYIPVTESYVYPDIVVNGSKPYLTDSNFDTLRNPILLIEVLSPSTEKKDRGIKAQNFRTIDSLKEYVFVSQEQYRVESYYRNKSGIWELSETYDINKSHKFRSLDIEIPMKKIYKNI